MGTLKRIDGKPNVETNGITESRLALYDQYGAMAYGIILQIIPQPESAQQVLVELFTSSEIDQCLESSASAACILVRLCRHKALESKYPSAAGVPAIAELLPTDQENMPKLVFDLSFRQGYGLAEVGERLQLPYREVMKAIRDYFTYLRTS